MDTTVELGQSSGNVYRVGPDTFNYLWPRIADLVEENPADVFRFISVEDLLPRIKDQTIDIWIGMNSEGEIDLAGMAQIIGPPDDCYYEVFWLGGSNLKAYLAEGLKKFEQMAMIYHAKSVRFGGRFGWDRLVDKYGYHTHRIELIKHLEYQNSKEIN